MNRQKKFSGGRRKSPKWLPKRFKGIVRVNTRGVGYIGNPFERPPGTNLKKEDVEIENYFLRGALNGDEILFTVHPKLGHKPLQGEVVKILKRAKRQFAGTLEKSGAHYFLNPDDRKMYRDIIVPYEPSLQNLIQKKVLVEIVSWGDYKKNPQGKIIKVFGKKGEHEAEIQSIIYDKGFESSFDPVIVEEAEKAAKSSEKNLAAEIAQRKDFRKVPTFTIDPEDAKDFDDAISIRRIQDPRSKIQEYEVGIHIADVSYYVREGSLLDKEARERGFSIYLVDRTIPMLPEILSNDLCSLNPEKDRLAFSVVIKISANGQVLNSWFGRTVIRSQKRFNYLEAQKIIDSKKGPFFYELNILNNMAKTLRTERFKKGAIDFDSEEVRFELDKNGFPVRVFKKERLLTHKLIEELMLLANRLVAEFMSKNIKKREVFIYRTHDLPNKEKIKELSIFLRALGYDLRIDKKGNVSSRDLNALFKKMEGKAEESLIKTAAVRAMAKAVYSVKNGGHFGLAFQYYTHFTSPIRRYSDLLVHRLLDRRLKAGKINPNEFFQFQKMSMDISEKETKIAEAERESIKYKQAEYMKEHLGKTFEGIISGLTEWGIYVEEINTKSEGLIKLRDMDDDFYELDEKNYSLVGRQTKKKFQLGGKVKIKVKNVDLERKLIDYKLA